jgi:hypothetical protein
LNISNSGYVFCILNDGINEFKTDSIYIHKIDNLNSSIFQSNDTLLINNNYDSYQWINCDSNSIILNENNSYFIPQSNGNFSVIIQNNICSDTLGCFNYNVNLISSKNNVFNIWPNPTENILNIKSSIKIESYKCYNLQGELILNETNIFKNEFVIDKLLYLSTSMYYFEIVFENGELQHSYILKK